jgi:hypothetical protein
MNSKKLICITAQKYITGGNTMTHKAKFATLFAASIAMLGFLCVAPKAEAACTAASIEGSYGFRFDGFVGPSSRVALKVGAFVPEAVVGEISFTATSSTGGTLTGSESGSFGGGVFQLTFPGTYTVNAPKCTGSLTRTLFEGFTVAADFVIVKGGDEIEFVSTTAGMVEAGVMNRE